MKCFGAKTFVPLFSVVVVCALLVFGVFGIIKNKPDAVAAKIYKDLQQLAEIMQQIDKECSILQIDCVANSIDFLTMKNVVGSEVGALTLAYPEKYKGPYLKKDLMYQEVPYQIVHARDGFFMVPGNGTRLPHGYKIGTDVVFTHQTDMQELLKPGSMLNYKGILFAVPLIMQQDVVIKKPAEKIDSLLKEFNAAMPFVKNFKDEKNQHSAYVEREC